MEVRPASVPRPVLVRELGRVSGVLRLRLAAGSAGLGREILGPRIQKPALALAGYLEQLHPGRVQVLGNSEVGYLRRLDAAVLKATVRALCAAPVAAVVVAGGNTVPVALRQACAAAEVPLFLNEQKTAAVIRGLNRWLEERFAPETTVHGVLLRLFGHGVLLLGRSGTGKSETALALLNRGHVLVADDVVKLRESPAGTLRGRCAEDLGHHIEIRGLGVLDVAELFGRLATLDETVVELAIELIEEGREVELDRLGIDEHRLPLLGVDVPHVQLQLRPGRDLATLVEVAARNQLLKARGVHGARRFVAAMDRNLRRVMEKGAS